jgi:colanic acid/amylovoran biosynthesis glycosyltransferase
VRSDHPCVKIAYLINQYPQPSQSFIRREMAALEQEGFEIDRFTVRTWNGKLVDPADIAEKEKTRVVLGAGYVALLVATLVAALTRPVKLLRAMWLSAKLSIGGDRFHIYYLAYLGEACVLLRWLREIGTRHVHAHFGTNSAVVAMLVRELGGPTYSFTVHGPEEFDRPLALKLCEKVAKAAFVVAISEYGKSQLYRWSRYPDWRKVHVVRCGVDASFLAGKPPELEDTCHLVCVGRLVEQKGQLLLIEAAAILKREGVRFEILLIGDGEMRREIEAQIAHHKLGEYIRLLGWQSNAEVRETILASRGMILPSFAEGLPVVIMEALALGRPVLSTYVAGIPELVDATNCGYLVPAGSVGELAKGMKELLGSSVERLRAMGREGARRVAERHDACVEARKLANLFRAVVSNEELGVQENQAARERGSSNDSMGSVVG